MIILDALSGASARGLRLTDLVEATGLGKATAHRLLNGLCDQRLVDFDEDTGRYFVGMKMLTWASAAQNRFSIAKLAEPSLDRLARKTQDTVYLIVRSGDDAICLDAREGTFPIKVLTLSVGDQRPLGIGAGSLAILAALPDPEVERILAQQAEGRSGYAFTDRKLRELITSTRRTGYAYNDIHVFQGMAEVTGMAAVAVAIKRSDGMPIAALHITSITSRMALERREEVTEMLKQECIKLEEDLGPVLESSIYQNR